MRIRKIPNKTEIYQSSIEQHQLDKEGKRWLKSKPRIFVIGGGFTGLLTAVILNAKAIKTGVLEKEKQLANSWITFDKNISQDGFFHFDNFEGLSLHSKSLLSRVLKEVGIFKKLDIIELKYSVFIQNKLQSFHLNNNANQLQTSLIKKYPQTKLRINDLFSILKSGFQKNFYFFEVLKRFSTAKDFLEHYTMHDKGLMLNFDWMWMEFGIPLNKLDPFSFAIFLADYIIGGWHYLSSGSHSLVGVLSKYIQSNALKKDLILKSSAVNSITVHDDYVTRLKTSNKTIKARKYILSSSIYDAFSYLIGDQSEAKNKYVEEINKLKLKNYKVSVCVGITKNFRAIGIVNEVIILNNESLDDLASYNAALNNDYENIPLKILNHGLLYRHHSNKTCSLNISFVDNFESYEHDEERELDKRRIKIQEIISKRLINYWPKIKGHIYFIKVFLHQDQGELTGNTMNGGYGLTNIDKNPWIDHMCTTPYKNLIIGSQQGLPGMNPWFSVYSALRASNIIEVKLRKKYRYTLTDTLSGTDILNLFSYIYSPINDRWQSFQIGWFFDNVYSLQMTLGEKKIDLKATTYEEASRLPFFVYTTTNALKKIINGQSGFLKQIFCNNMRCKGGAFKFIRLMRECFPRFQQLNEVFKEFLTPKIIKPKNLSKPSYNNKNGRVVTNKEKNQSFKKQPIKKANLKKSQAYKNSKSLKIQKEKRPMGKEQKLITH